MTTDHNEAMRLAGELVAPIGTQTSYQTAQQSADLLVKQAEQIAGLGAERDTLRAEVDQMTQAIAAFCEGNSWAVDAWKNRPDIKPLFDIDTARKATQ